jgi:hypothetical protein
LSELRLAEATLDPGELQEGRSGRGLVIQLCH